MSTIDLSMDRADVLESRVDPERPWLGLKSFEENCREYFFGRSDEINSLRERILDHRLTTLFGHSGLGKTSLLRAGVLPALREEGWFPVFIRLAFDSAAPTIQTQIIRELKTQLESNGIKSLECLNANADLNLWSIFHDPEIGFVASSGVTKAKVVLVFDQFEEVWTVGREFRPEESDALMLTLAALVENRAPLAEQIRLSSDDEFADRLVSSARTLRVVFSLREDYLHWLERWRGQMPSLMDNRLELTPLTSAQALQAVVEPGRIRTRANPSLPAIVDEETGIRIVRKSGGIPPLLSLICERLNERRLGIATSQVTVDDFESRADDVLREFYLSSFTLVPSEVRYFVEDRLISSAGVRASMNMESAVSELSSLNVPMAQKELEKLVKARILSVDYRGGITRIELTHDLLAPFAVHFRGLRHDEQRIARQQFEESARRYARVKLIALATVVLGLFSTSVFGGIAWYRGNKVNRLLAREAVAYTTFGNKAWRDWNSNSSDHGMPLQPGKTKWHEALAQWNHALELNARAKQSQHAIAKVMATTSLAGIPASEFKAQAKWFELNHQRNMAVFWESNSLTLRHIDKLESPTKLTDCQKQPVQAAFSSDGKRLCVHSSDGVLSIYDSATAKIEKSVAVADQWPNLKIINVCFVPGQNSLAITFDNQTACIWTLSTTPAKAVLFQQSLPLKPTSFSSSGEWFASFSKLPNDVVGITIRNLRDGKVKHRVLDVAGPVDALNDLIYIAASNKLLFSTRKEFAIWSPADFPQPELEYSQRDDIVISYFYQFDLARIAERELYTRTDSLIKLSPIDAKYEDLVISPTGDRLAARVLRLSSSSGCGSYDSQSANLLPPAPAVSPDDDVPPRAPDETPDLDDMPPRAPDDEPPDEPDSKLTERESKQSRIGLKLVRQATDSKDVSNSMVGPVAEQKNDTRLPSYHMMMMNLKEDETIFAAVHSPLKTCFFSTDSRSLCAVDKSDSLWVFDLQSSNWISSCQGRRTISQAAAVDNGKLLAIRPNGNLLLLEPPTVTSLLTSFDVPGLAIAMRSWKGQKEHGLYVISEDKFSLCLTEVGGSSPQRETRFDDAHLAEQRYSAFDTSGSVAIQMISDSEAKAIIWTPPGSTDTVPIAPEQTALVIPGSVGTPASPCELLAQELNNKFGSLEKLRLHCSVTLDGKWQALPFGPLLPYAKTSKIKVEYTNMVGERLSRVEFASDNTERVHGVGIRFLNDTDEVEGPSRWNQSVITAYAFHPNNRQIMIGQQNGVVSLWDLSTMSGPVVEFKHSGLIKDIQIDHSGLRMLVIAESTNAVQPAFPSVKTGRVSLWDLENKQLQIAEIDHVQRAKLSPSGKRLLFVNDGTGTANVVDTETNEMETIPLWISYNLRDLAIDFEDRYVYLAMERIIYRWRSLLGEPMHAVEQVSVADTQRFAQVMSAMKINADTGELEAEDQPQSNVALQSMLRVIRDLNTKMIKNE